MHNSFRVGYEMVLQVEALPARHEKPKHDRLDEKTVSICQTQNRCVFEF